MTVRPAKTQISLGIRPVWSESSLCAQWVAKNPSFLHADSEDSDQTGRMPRLIWVFAGRTCHFVGFVIRRLNYVRYIMRKSWLELIVNKRNDLSYIKVFTRRGWTEAMIWAASGENLSLGLVTRIDPKWVCSATLLELCIWHLYVLYKFSFWAANNKGGCKGWCAPLLLAWWYAHSLSVLSDGQVLPWYGSYNKWTA